MQIREDLTPFRQRTTIVAVGVVLILSFLLLRLVHLQIVDRAYWRQMAENNRLRRIPVQAQRGRVYDRRGAVLADNVPTWELLLFPDEAPRIGDTVLFLARAGIVNACALLEALEERRIARLAPLVVSDDLSWEQVAQVRAHQSDYPELSVISGFRRYYPHGGMTSHVVGHLRLVSRETLDRNPNMDRNALVGATGVEALQDPALSGTPGERWVVVSAVGRQLGLVKELNAIAGQDVSTTLDLRLQRTAAEALGEAAGAVIALDPSSGAVRVLYSSPTFDPNLFVGSLSHSEWQTVAEDPSHPLQNRCLQGVYPPGSTIKPFLALGGLTDGLISSESRVYCRGSVTLFNHTFRCWHRGGHGSVDLERSLEVSCDSFYYLLGRELGIDRLSAWLHLFGFGTATGLGGASEASGLVGGPEWSERVRKTPWQPGEVISMAIGQGPLLTTTVQLTRAYAALANGGYLVSPYLVETEGDRTPQSLGLDPTYLAQVTDGLVAVVHGSEGTAWRLASLPMAGKTGTAQVARLQEDTHNEDLAPHLRHHAWFVGWAPLDKPQLVVAVLVEHGGGGASVAAPVVAAIVRAALAGGTTYGGAAGGVD
jgi:penicillin-binding protein 2